MLTNDGLYENTVTQIKYKLQEIAASTDVFDPEKVKNFIATTISKKTGENYADDTKNKFAWAIDKFYEKQGIQWVKPFYVVKEKTPLIPTTDNVNAIIQNASPKYVTIFTLLEEVGCDGMELSRVKATDIDAEQGTISISGAKGHAGGIYRLKSRTTEMLRVYLHKYGLPFPDSRIMGQVWRDTRERAAKKLCKSELEKIMLKSLRNYSGAQLYYKVTDPIMVMRHLRHKKLETTMHYIRGVVPQGEREYVTQVVQLGQPDTVQRITDLLNNGFKKESEADGYQFYRKLKS
jgi:integrase